MTFVEEIETIKRLSDEEVRYRKFLKRWGLILLPFLPYFLVVGIISYPITLLNKTVIKKMNELKKASDNAKRIRINRWFEILEKMKKNEQR